MSSGHGDRRSVPQPDRWYDFRLGPSFRDQGAARKFYTVRYDFKPASIDKGQVGTLHKSKDNRVNVEFHNDQPGRPNVKFEGTNEDCKDNDAVFIFNGQNFRLERLHRAMRLRYVRLPGEAAVTANAPAANNVGGSGNESHSPPAKIPKIMNSGRAAAHSVQVEIERIDVAEARNAVARSISKGNNGYQSSTPDPEPEPLSPPDPRSDDHGNLNIVSDNDDEVPAQMASAAIRGFDMNIPSHLDLDDEIVDVNDEADEGLNAADALRAHQTASEGQRESSSSDSGSSSNSSSGSDSGSGSSSESDASDGDSVSNFA